MSNNKPHNKGIIFPEESASVIAETLKKYRLKETAKQTLKKLELQQKTNGRIIAELVQKRAKNEIGAENFVAELKQELSITQKQAREIAQILQEKILSKVKIGNNETTDAILADLPTRNTSLKKYPKQKTTKDIYRELVE